MIELLQRLFGRASAPAGVSSKDDAKQRLKFLLIHDQVDLTPAQMDAMKAEIIAVISKYVELDESDTEVRLERNDGQIALVSSIPVRRVVERPNVPAPKSSAPLPVAPAVAPPVVVAPVVVAPVAATPVVAEPVGAAPMVAEPVTVAVEAEDENPAFDAAVPVSAPAPGPVLLPPVESEASSAA